MFGINTLSNVHCSDEPLEGLQAGMWLRLHIFMPALLPNSVTSEGYRGRAPHFSLLAPINP